MKNFKKLNLLFVLLITTSIISKADFDDFDALDKELGKNAKSVSKSSDSEKINFEKDFDLKSRQIVLFVNLQEINTKSLSVKAYTEEINAEIMSKYKELESDFKNIDKQRNDLQAKAEKGLIEKEKLMEEAKKIADLEGEFGQKQQMTQADIQKIQFEAQRNLIGIVYNAISEFEKLYNSNKVDGVEIVIIPTELTPNKKYDATDKVLKILDKNSKKSELKKKEEKKALKK